MKTTRTVISKSKTRLKGTMQEMVVYKEEVGKGKYKSTTKHEAVKR